MTEKKQVGSNHSCCVRGCLFKSHHGCIGFDNTEDNFDVLT